MRLMASATGLQNFDPRAKIIKRACDEVLDKLGVRDPLLDLPSSWKRPH